jgi:hypothetical protein
VVAAVALVLADTAVVVDPGVEHGKVLHGSSREVRVP